MKKMGVKQGYYAIFTIFIIVAMSATIAVGQAGNWQQFKAQVFQVAEVVAHMVTQENVSPGEMTALQNDVAILVQQAQVQQCPSQNECDLLSYVLTKSQEIVNFPPGGVFSVQQGKEIASLRQAVSDYYSNMPPSQSSSSSTVAQQPASSSAYAIPVSQQSTPLDFEIAYVYRPGGMGQFQILQDKGTLHSGDHYKILFQTPHPCYVYIFQADSSNTIYSIFPLSDFRGVEVNLENPVQPDQPYFVPAKDKSFVLDKTRGTEQIYFLAFQEPDMELEQIARALNDAQNRGKNAQLKGMQGRVVHAITRAKGIAKISPDMSDATQVNWIGDDDQTYSILGQRLQSCDGCVQIFTFDHQ